MSRIGGEDASKIAIVDLRIVDGMVRLFLFIVLGERLRQLAQRLDPFVAAAAGVWLHAAAGREAARRQGAAEGVIAGDVVDALPAARAGADG